jgi:hypothetical protein
MRQYLKDYKRVIAIKERSAGNESVGSMWLETKSFDKETPISKIVKWADTSDGKLIITIDEDSLINDKDF